MTISHSPHTAGRAESPRVADMMRRYAEARARLMNGRAPVCFAVPTDQPEPEAPPPKPHVLHTVPLNMLAPCSWRFLLALAAVRGGVASREILGLRRVGPVARARFDAMSLVYRHTQQSMPGVGRLFDRDHTTVIHALQKTGSTKKLVELLPTSDAARRPKGSFPAIVAAVQPTPIPAPASKPANAVQRVVRAGYRGNKSKSEIAAEAGITQRSVLVIASRMGLRRADFRTKDKLEWEAAEL